MTDGRGCRTKWYLNKAHTSLYVETHHYLMGLGRGSVYVCVRDGERI